MERGIPVKKKGFTLVELIVVLVILAILAALLIPALTGYIDKANEEKLQATTRQVVVAAQSVVSEAYAESEGFQGSTLTATIWAGEDSATFGQPGDKVKIYEICELAEIAQDITKVGDAYQGKFKNGISWVGFDYGNDGKLIQVLVSDGTQTCTYDGKTGDYTVEKY